jgi:hypothetical protein
MDPVRPARQLSPSDRTADRYVLRGTSVASASVLAMKKLEARYYPPFTRSRFLVVAHIFFPSDGSERKPLIRPIHTRFDQGSPAALLSTLRYLVHTTAPYTWERLTSLRSRYWSFVSVQLLSEERVTDLTLVHDT